MESRNYVVWIISATLLVALLVSVGAALFAKPETAGERIVAIKVKCLEDGPEDSTHRKGVPLILQLSSLDVPDGFNLPDLNVRAGPICGKPAKVHVVSPLQWNSALPMVVGTPGAQPATIHAARKFVIMRTAIYGAADAAPTPFVSASDDYQSGTLPGCMFQGCGSAEEENPRRTSLTPPMLTRQILWRQAEPKTLGARGKWWEVFKDPVLNELEMQAGTGSLGIATAVARVGRARATARIRACGADSQVALNFFDAMVRATNSQPRSDQEECMRESTAYDTNEIQVTLYTNYERDSWARVRRITKGTTLEAVENKEVRQAILFTLEAEIAQTYFLIRCRDEELRILRESIELGAKAVDLVVARSAGGSTGEIDLARARKRVDETQVEAKRVSERSVDLQRRLAGLLGVAPERFRVEPSPFDPRPPAIPPGVPSDLLERRPDIVQAELALATRNRETDMAEVALFPALPLTSNQGFASSELMTMVDGYGNKLAPPAPLWQPPFSAGRIEFDADNAVAIYENGAFDQGTLDYARRILRAFVEVEDALLRLRLLEQRAQYDATAMADLQLAARQRTLRSKEPLLAFVEADIVQRVSLQVRRQLVREVNDRMLMTVALIKALGGKWGGAPEFHAPTTFPESGY
jgi:outer membrane protein, multidrug efflux system